MPNVGLHVGLIVWLGKSFPLSYLRPILSNALFWMDWWMDDDGVVRKVEIVMYEGIMMKCCRMMKYGEHVGFRYDEHR